MKIDYQSRVIVDENLSLNADSFLALMNKYFPGRDSGESDLSSILTEVRKYSGSISDFEKRIQRCIPIIDNMECEEMEANNHHYIEMPYWGLSGVARTILDLTSDEYWARRGLGEPWKSITEHYRNVI